MGYEIKQAICQTLLDVLMIGLGVFLVVSFGAMWNEIKGGIAELRKPGAIKELLGFGAAMSVWVALWFIF